MTLKPSTSAISGFLTLLLVLTLPAAAQPYNPADHTDPINLTPLVREARVDFYNLNYDRALARFETVLKANPQNPMAIDYVLTTIIFRELYHQDLLDTTYYAHNSFLSSKRDVPVPQATRQRIEDLTNSAIELCDKQIRDNPNDKNAYFARGDVVRLEAEMAEHMRDVWQLAEELRAAELVGSYPRNPDACMKYGRPCTFYDVCTGAASLNDATRFKRLETAHPELAPEAA